MRRHLLQKDNYANVENNANVCTKQKDIKIKIIKPSLKGLGHPILGNFTPDRLLPLIN